MVDIIISLGTGWASMKVFRVQCERTMKINISMHEMGKYDIPAEIDHVLKTTGEPKLYYIGFSMGTSMFWIMMSLHPEYNEKVRLMTALAPVVYINNMVGFPRLIAPFESLLKGFLDLLGNGEFLPPWLLKLYNTIGTQLCSNLLIAESFCANINFLYAGWDLPQSQIVRIIANINIEQSRKILCNEVPFRYGRTIPPLYTLRNTAAPVALFWGPNDAVVNPIDVARLASELPNVVLNSPIDFSLWNHFDYHLARDANELVNDRVLKLLPNF